LLVKHGYRVRYVPHEVIEDYNATYNVTFEDKHIVTNAARELNIPLNEIWISEMWRSYEKYILFHELREIYHRANGMSANEALKKPCGRVFPCGGVTPYSKR
jgi:competence protein ComEA